MSVRQYHIHRETARSLVHTRLAYWSAIYPFQYNQVRIKNNRRAWGSCSSKKNLNFNWRLVHLPSELSDYVIVHELCHTVHLNHSRDFWNLVAGFVPQWRQHRVQLRQYLIGVQ